MPTRKSERTLRMMEAFMDLHNQGLSIPEIADRFQLTSRSIYVNLDEIAEQNHVTRDSLLQIVRPNGIMPHGIFRSPVQPIDEGNFRACAANALAELDHAQTEVRKTIACLEEYPDEVGG